MIFYDSNTWSYTKLGHINLSKSELIDLLGDEDVVITMDMKYMKRHKANHSNLGSVISMLTKN